MADMFFNFDARLLLRNKHVLFLGDSNVRAQYKDLTWLMNYDSLISKKCLRSKLETSFLGDRLVKRSRLSRGRDFMEWRMFHERNNGTRLEFMFLTRCYNLELEKLFKTYKRNPNLVPDVILINSCLWDLTRWGPHGVPQYKDNMVKLMKLMSQCLPKECLVIWSTALPTAPHIKGALIIKQVQPIETMMRFEVVEANTFARQVVVAHGFDVLDYHYYIRMQIHRRAKDGVHYLPVPVRFMTNLLLTHIALSWDRRLPNNIQNLSLYKAKEMSAIRPELRPEVKAPSTGIFSKINLVSPKVTRTRGIRVMITPGSGSRKSRIVDDKIPVASTSFDSKQNSVMRSVVHVPQNRPKYVASTRPYFARKNKKKYRKRPYQDRFNYIPHPKNTFSYYNPYPNNNMPHTYSKYDHNYSSDEGY